MCQGMDCFVPDPTPPAGGAVATDPPTFPTGAAVALAVAVTLLSVGGALAAVVCLWKIRRMKRSKPPIELVVHRIFQCAVELCLFNIKVT